MKGEVTHSRRLVCTVGDRLDHNAHHERMQCPWYSLHELDHDLFNGDEGQYITLPELLGNYHRYRLSRLSSGQGRGINEQSDRSLETFDGAIEVSFLVLPA